MLWIVHLALTALVHEHKSDLVEQPRVTDFSRSEEHETCLKIWNCSLRFAPSLNVLLRVDQSIYNQSLKTAAGAPKQQNES